jgi:hypothetical protein
VRRRTILMMTLMMRLTLSQMNKSFTVILSFVCNSVYFGL